MHTKAAAHVRSGVMQVEAPPVPAGHSELTRVCGTCVFVSVRECFCRHESERAAVCRSGEMDAAGQ